MLGLSDGKRISMIRSAVLTQYTRVTDRRTDRRKSELAWHIRAIAYMLSRVKTTDSAKYTEDEEYRQPLPTAITVFFALQSQHTLMD